MKMIIVGAGISGLATGYYARLNGFDTEIFEMHSIPGGLCTAWTRKGYTFDLSMHFLMNSRRGPLKQLWDELGFTRNHTFHYHKGSRTVEGEGKRLDVTCDREEVEKQMLAISPGDEAPITEFLDLYYGKSAMDFITLDAPEIMGLGQKIKMFAAMMPAMKTFRKYSGQTVDDLAARFSDPFLGRAVRYQIDSPGWPMPGFPLSFLQGMLETSVIDSGTPLGGSKQVMAGLADRFEKRGGKIRYKCKASDLIIEKDCVKGIRLEDGSEHFADEIVWCADGHHLLFDILKGGYMDKQLTKMYRDWTPVCPVVHAMFGVDMDLSGEPHGLVWEAPSPVRVGNREFKWLTILNHSFDKSTAPEGKSAVEVWYGVDYDYWNELYKDREAYKAEKERIARDTAVALDIRWPGFKSRIEMTDVPTPATYERYTGNWRASPDGWYLMENNLMSNAMKMTVPGLKNLHTVNQWGAPYTGTVSTSLGGRQLVQVLCKKRGIPFKTG